MTERLRITNAGNVGIGTASPANALHVHNSSGQQWIRVSGSGGGIVNFYDTAAGVNQKLYQWRSEGGLFRMALVTDAENAFAQQNILVANSAGNVGVGTASPTNRLHVFGGNVFHQYSATAGQEYGFYTAINNNHFTSNLYFDGQWKMITPGKGALFSTAPFSDAAFSVYADNTSRAANAAATINTLFQVKMDGSVGVGTTTPSYRLDVQGGQLNASGGLCIAGDCKTAWSQVGGSQWTTGGANISYSAGSVGIGTAAPTAPLEVQNADNTNFTAYFHNLGGWGPVLRLNSANYGTLLQTETNGTPLLKLRALGPDPFTGNGYLELTPADNTNFAAFMSNSGGSGRVLRLQSASVQSTVPVFTVEANNGGTTVLSAMANGSVGVGTSTPSSSYKLDVNGAAHVSGDLNATGTITGGNIQAKYQDVAEWVPSGTTLPAGTVVVLDATRNNHVTMSLKAYDTRVAGVVSAQPGITLGEGGEGRSLVATTGRVRVKVDATRAPIAIGDLLVTSDVPGVAMKSVPVDLGGTMIHRPGTIMGKALEPLEKGTGEILVLLSLQ
jgi:hypothetical protein